MDPDNRVLTLYLLVAVTLLGICLGIALTELSVFVRGAIAPPPIP